LLDWVGGIPSFFDLRIQQERLVIMYNKEYIDTDTARLS